MKKEFGKNQSYSRVLNNLLVIKHLQQKQLSATELSEHLSLSNAALSSILKQLLRLGMIKVSCCKNVKELGRKRVLYTLDDTFGLFLNISISNHQAHISVANFNEELIEQSTIEVEKYDAEAIYRIILLSSQILLKPSLKAIPLKCVIISLPGRVNQESGQLLLSKQFDPNLFKETNFIRNAFENQYPNTPVLISNDVNMAARGELRKGALVGCDNALFISVDQGIGGSLILNGKLFLGDNGYAGEFGLLHVDNGYLDDYVSLRVLRDFANEITKEKVSRTKLIELYKENETIHNKIIESGHYLGRGIRNLVEVFDITKVVLAGRCTLFGEEYLSAIRSEFKELQTSVDISFTNINNEAKVIGAIGMGVEYIISKEIIGEKVYE